MECELRHTHEVKDAGGKVTCVVVIGEVVLMHVHDGVAGAGAAPPCAGRRTAML